MKLTLQEFDYTNVYNKEKENGNSDGLIRMFSETEWEGATFNDLTEKEEEVGMITDIEESGDTEEKRGGDDELGTACTDLSDKEEFEMLKEIHDSPTGRHAGINRKYRKLKQFINWRSIKKVMWKIVLGSIKNSEERNDPMPYQDAARDN